MYKNGRDEWKWKGFLEVKGLIVGVGDEEVSIFEGKFLQFHPHFCFIY